MDPRALQMPEDTGPAEMLLFLWASHRLSLHWLCSLLGLLHAGENNPSQLYQGWV